MTQLLIALRFYALGSMEVSIADFAGVSMASVSRIIFRVSDALARKRPEFVRMPETDQERQQCSASFFSIARFPRVIGAIDCTHVKIQSPGGEHAECYRNRKSWFSFNVQTVAGSDLKIQNIVARWPGATHDSTIFNASHLKMRFEHGDFGRYLLVGDSGYAASNYMAIPFLEVDSVAKNLYNESQIHTRNVVERSYGVWKRRFPILSMGMRIKLERVEAVIVACAVLHNIAIDANDVEPPTEIPEFEEIIAGLQMPTAEEMRLTRVPAGPTGRLRPSTVRDFLVANYFASLNQNENEIGNEDEI